MKDPFTLVYEALWTMVERNQNLHKLIPPGNRIKYENDSPPKEGAELADTPELVLLSAGGGFGKGDSNTTRGCTRIYSWLITTGDITLNPLFNGISWELYRTMIDYECVLCNLMWCECRFVIDCRLTSAEDSPQFLDPERNIPGWTSIWQIEVDFSFPLQKLRLK